MSDKGKMTAAWRIEKFKGDFKSRKEAIAAGVKPYETIDIIENLLLNEGINELWTHLCSAGGTKFDNTNAYIGVGDSATGENATQTGLQAASNKLYKGMDGGYPTYGTAQKAVWKVTFGSAEANWAWNEITVANGNSDAADNLNRKVQAIGTKVNGMTWSVELTITLS